MANVFYVNFLFVFLYFKGEVSKIKKEVDFDLMVPDLSVMDALDGFVFVLSEEGQCLFVSPNVAQYLGITQVLYYCFKCYWIFYQRITSKISNDFIYLYICFKTKYLSIRYLSKYASRAAWGQISKLYTCAAPPLDYGDDIQPSF